MLSASLFDRPIISRAIRRVGPAELLSAPRLRSGHSVREGNPERSATPGTAWVPFARLQSARCENETAAAGTCSRPQNKARPPLKAAARYYEFFEEQRGWRTKEARAGFSNANLSS